MSPLARILVLPIRFYRRFVTVWTPPSCRFRPTCSAYAEEAIEVHGAAKGLFLAAWRILRCQPFSRPGRDPVPPKGRWRAAARDGAQGETGASPRC